METKFGSNVHKRLKYLLENYFHNVIDYINRYAYYYLVTSVECKMICTLCSFSKRESIKA